MTSAVDNIEDDNTPIPTVLDASPYNSTTSRKWLPLFLKFIRHLRIDSKEIYSPELAGVGGSKFTLYNSQRIFLEQLADGLENNVHTFHVLKARQLGMSTISLAIDIFWLAMHPGCQGALVVDTDDNRDKFRLILRRYIQSFPKQMFGSSFGIKKGGDNRNFMHFTNGSTLDLLVAGKRKKATLGESRAYWFLHATELANYGSPEGIAALRETLAEHHPHRLYIYESTAKGFNHWKDMWDEAERDSLSKKAIFIGWWAKEDNALSSRDARFAAYSYEPEPDERRLIREVKTRYNHDINMNQLAWIRWRASDTSISDGSLAQNLPWVAEDAFVMSGASFFQIRRLNNDLDRITNPEEPINFQGYRFYLGNDFFAVKMEQITNPAEIERVELRVWEHPSEHGDYVIGVDPAWGRNDWKDRSAIEIYRCFGDCLVQVAEYASADVDTRQTAWMLAYLAGAYRNCFVNIELTGGVGTSVMTEMANLRNQLRSPTFEQQVGERAWEDFLANARYYLYHRPDNPGAAGYVYNWKTTRDSKFTLMNNYRDSHVKGELIINSVHLAKEMQTIVQDGSTIEAPGRSKDDRAFASALANQTWIEWVKPRMMLAGMTYDAVRALEDGKEMENKTGTFLNRIVVDFMKNAADKAENEDRRPSWMVQRGLA